MNMRGFTLIETIVYIALLGFLMTGALVSVYGIVESGSITQKKTSTQDEGNFVLRKIEWALASAESIASPPSGGSSSFLSVTQVDGTLVEFHLVDNVLEMRVDGTSYERLTSDAVEVGSLTFTSLPGTPQGIEATAVLDDIEFTTRRYLRQ